jgi:TIR domain-containing protein
MCAARSSQTLGGGDLNDVARRLGNFLKSLGCKVWIDEAEILPGDSLIQKISEGIVGSDYLFALLSPNSITSEWVTRELNLALTQEINGRFTKVIPIVVAACTLPPFLLDKKRIDLHENYRDGLWEIERWLGLETDEHRFVTTNRFLKQIICFDIADHNINDAKSIWWFTAVDFAKIAVRCKYFRIKMHGIDFAFYEAGDLHICGAYTSDNFQVEEAKGTEWYEMAAKRFIEIDADTSSKETWYYAPSYEVSEEVLRDFGFLD